MKSKKSSDIKNRIIKRKNDEIDLLKSRISELEIDCKEKEEIINSIEHLRVELNDVVDDLKKKREEYDNIIADVKMMRRVMNEELFNGKWSIIKMLAK